MPTTWATWLNGARTVIFAMENQRPPRFLGNPHVNHALLSDPADGLAPGVAAQTLLPSTLKTVSASGSYSFRGSITRPGDPLCTLRGQGRPCTTQHSVPAGCQPLPGRLSSCRVPSEAFSRVLPHMTPHSSRLNLAHFQRNRSTPAGQRVRGCERVLSARSRHYVSHPGFPQSGCAVKRRRLPVGENS